MSYTKPNTVCKKEDGSMWTTCYNDLDGVGIIEGEHFFDVNGDFPEPDEILKRPQDVLEIIKPGGWEK